MSRRVGFAGLLTADAVSLVGSRMTFVALPWMVLVTTGSATKTGVVAFTEMLPYAVACALGGPFIDSLGPRRTAIATDLASVAAVGSIVAISRSGGLSFAALIALVATAGGLRGLSDTAKTAIFPGVVGTAGISLVRATTIRDGLGRVAVLVGAPAAGVLIAITDAPTVLLVDAVSFGVAAALVGLFVPPVASGPAGASSTEPRPSYLGQLREGIAYVRGDRLVTSIMIMLFVTNLIDQAYATVLVPVWARELFGSPVGLGLTFAAFAAGAVLGNAGYAVLAPRLPRFAPFAVGFALGGAPRFVTLAVDAPLWTVMAVAFAGGIGICVVNPILGATYYERVPAALHARVLGLSRALAYAGIPLGSLLGGLLVDSVGIRLALLLCAAGYGIATAAPLTSRTWRELDSSRPPATPAGSPAGQPDGEDREGSDAGR